ncbi:MAG TPA: hypothetical protein VIP77_03480 [Jiangellaceae bacterium]
MKIKETTATEVYAHALSHGDKPVIHGAEIDYDDVHDGVHYHADLLAAAVANNRRLRDERDEAAGELAVIVDVFDDSDRDPRTADSYPDALAKYRRLDAELRAGYEQTAALRAKRDQDAAMATYEVSA